VKPLYLKSGPFHPNPTRMKLEVKLPGSSTFKKIHSIGLISLALLISSCVHQREVEYVRDPEKTSKTFKEAQVGDYLLKPNDELYIQISSLDDPSANIFSAPGAQQSTTTLDPYGASLMSYNVDKDGFILLPVLGRIQVRDKTTFQVSESIKESLSNILSQPMVKVKLVNRYVSVLGEVRSPGHFPYSQDKLTILDAIGLAGDITDYGSRQDVILIRNENGQNIRIPVDITRSDLLASSYYYIRPNDIVYIKSLRKKFWGMRQFPFGVIMSTISTALLIYTVVK
jgi:polysaccharide biosynthesis/export protein